MRDRVIATEGGPAPDTTAGGAPINLGANGGAIAMIIEQGEAPSAAHPDAHVVVFDTIRLEYLRELESARSTSPRPGCSSPSVCAAWR